MSLITRSKPINSFPTGKREQEPTMSTFLTIIFSILVITALAVAAYTDLKSRVIPNRVSSLVFLCGIGLICVRAFNGLALTAAVISPLFSSALIFGGGLILFARGAMGGGDVKLMAAVVVGLPTAMVLPFLFWMALVGGVVALCTSVYALTQRSWLNLAELETGFETHLTLPIAALQVPYGIAISASGIAVTVLHLLALEI